MSLDCPFWFPLWFSLTLIVYLHYLEESFQSCMLCLCNLINNNDSPVSLFYSGTHCNHLSPCEAWLVETALSYIFILFQFCSLTKSNFDYSKFVHKNVLVFQSSDYEHIWWRLFQKRVLWTKLDICIGNLWSQLCQQW